MSAPNDCAYVRDYLDRFLDDGARSQINLGRVSEHVGSCPVCYQRLEDFFHTVELPESSYLRETIDELALALYNLAKAIIRDLPAKGPDDVTENVIITEDGGGSIDENVRAGHEMIDDAEDYSGSSRVGDMDLDELREVLADAEAGRVLRVDLALAIFSRVVRMVSRYTYEAWNWIGVLCMQKGDLERALAAFGNVLSAPDGARNVRSWTRCNLSYLYRARGDLDRAVQSAHRSVVLAEEDGKDPYFGQFAGLYIHLLRDAEGDTDAGGRLLDAMLATPEGCERLRGHLGMPSVKGIRAVLEASPLAARFAELLS